MPIRRAARDLDCRFRSTSPVPALLPRSRKRRGIPLALRRTPGGGLLRSSADDGLDRDAGPVAAGGRRRRRLPFVSASSCCLPARPGCLLEADGASYGERARLRGGPRPRSHRLLRPGRLHIRAPDGPLLFFWLLSIERMSVALDPAIDGEPAIVSCLGSGSVWPGVAMLSKYHGVSPDRHRPLSGAAPSRHGGGYAIGPYLAMLVALIVFSPVIIWNATHGWASFLFQEAVPSPARRALAG